MTTLLRRAFTAALALSFILLTSPARVEAANSCQVLFGKTEATAATLEYKGKAASKTESAVVSFPRPVVLNTRFELYAQSFPIKDASGRPRTDLPLYHVRANENFYKWLDQKSAPGRKKQAFERKWNTEENQNTKNVLEHLYFRTSQEDPIVGRYYETIPSPELYEYQRGVWNKTQPEAKQIVVKARRTGDDGQVTMAKMWTEDYSISIAEPLKVQAGRDAKFREDENTKLNNEGAAYVPKLAKDRVSDRYLLTEASHLFFHDITQWTNSIWMNRASIERSRKVNQFYLDALKIVEAKGLVTLEKPAEGVRPDLNDGVPLGPRGYTARRFLLDVIHDSQRGIHSITHIVSWLVEKPQGLVPGKDYVLDRGPTAMIETEVHLQGLGARAHGSEAPFPAPNLLRTWTLARETTDPVTLESALDFITNRDMARAQLVVEELATKVPEIQALYKSYEEAGAFTPVPDSMIKSWAREIRWRYYNMQ